jgi:hypothetical protein
LGAYAATACCAKLQQQGPLGCRVMQCSPD